MRTIIKGLKREKLVASAAFALSLLLLSAPASATDSGSRAAIGTSPRSQQQAATPAADACPEHVAATPKDERLAIVPLPRDEGGDLALVVTQPDELNLRVDWRFVTAGTAPQPRIDACVGPEPAIGESSSAFKDKILISLLVDDSKSMGDTLKPQANFVKELMAAAAGIATPVQFSLTLFSSGADERIVFGAPAGTIARELDGTKPEGKTTELFRSVRDAIRRVAVQKRDQKAPDARAFVLVFSDGRAEDKGYTYEDVRKVALEEGVAVYTFGYPGGKGGGSGGVPQPELQVLRRLAEDTGGAFYSATAEPRFPDASSLLAALSNGGSKTFKLPPAVSAEAANRRQTVSLIVGKAATGETSRVAFPATLAAPKPTPVVHDGEPSWLKIMSIALAIFAALLLVLLLLLIWSRRIMARMAKPVSSGPQMDYLPAPGFRVYRPGDQQEPRAFVDYASIGSGPDNQVVVVDEAVAKRAAVISRDGDGQFRLRPESASTQARLNGRNTSDVSPLHDGDLIQIGEGKLRFVSTAPTEVLPKPLRRLAVNEEREAEKEHDPAIRSRVDEWWPRLAVRWPTLARYWSRIAPRLKKRMGVVYRVLSARLARLAAGEEFDFFSINVLIFLAIQILFVLFGDGSEEDDADAFATGEPGTPVAFLDVLKRIPGMDRANRRFKMQGNVCRIRRKREPDYREHEDLLLYDETVSREPLVVIERRQPGHFVIKDLGATNRVLVNNRRVVQEAPLDDGSIIEVGEVPIRFLQLA